MRFLIPNIIIIIVVSFIIGKFWKYKRNGIKLLNAYRDLPHTQHDIELGVVIKDSDFFNSMRLIPTYKTKAFLFDGFIYIDQCNSMIFTRNNTRIIFPLVLSTDTRILKAKFPSCFIAKVTNCHFSAWNELKIQAELVRNGTLDLELNILFLENKNESSLRLMQILNPDR